jgi:outer membrane biosynthesis protein TonB
MGLMDTRHKRKSMILTVIIHVAIILLLFWFGLKYLDPPLESGIAINFGTTDVGQGRDQPTEPVRTAPKQSSPQPVPQEQTEAQEEVVTQDTEDAPVIQKKEEKQEQPEVEEEKPVEEPPKKPDPKPDQSTTDALSSLINAPKNDGSADGSEGDDNQAGDKGSPDGDPNASSYYGSGAGLDGDGNYLLGGRKALNKEKFVQDCNEAGTVVVSIEVDRRGRVISATPGVRGTTNNSRCLLEPAKRAALATRFNADDKAPAKQIGKIIYKFSLSN